MEVGMTCQLVLDLMVPFALNLRHENIFFIHPKLFKYPPRELCVIHKGLFLYKGMSIIDSTCYTNSSLYINIINVKL